MLEIGNGCFKNMIQFLIDGLNELKSVKIGDKSFELEKNGEEGSKCSVETNTDRLQFILFNLLSLKSIKLDIGAFVRCHSVVFESMND
ncbi:hypothetical protein JH06_4672 [Blastocystis sp. subtype 4]|uniref:hypothetical protein n=1 Tax=Blastocystis sp. subtype 4 TaxID=944170 RepID=UPI000711DB8F|nr:hypothetical protein JH06_4672 [Blastocystis sp. subtype 4]KNB41961.1 hypothetical protein JH06_4672 [Blastocystis sp. subtype 4]|eukprot:XP_014525404.1 hypothetical protein JH06_4672 [Blastocystis sp. subtype 4]